MKTTESLEHRIEAAVEHLVREHLVTCEATATAAIGEAFRRASQPSHRQQRSEKKRSRSRSSSLRRSRDEIAALTEQLYAAISRHPGETMAVIAASVGVSPRELSLPATLLRRDGRVRSVGQRQGTRYFPMGA